MGMKGGARGDPTVFFQKSVSGLCLQSGEQGAIAGIPGAVRTKPARRATIRASSNSCDDVGRAWRYKGFHDRREEFSRSNRPPFRSPLIVQRVLPDTPPTQTRPPQSENPLARPSLFRVNTLNRLDSTSTNTSGCYAFLDGFARRTVSRPLTSSNVEMLK
jgi:hypothetical protein